ncbi:branched-chain amino acid ABC transporter permease [Frigidibacter sp. RF13]|uniref:branched-chain amino acid ABC transporter permease n=1 Tax=Frigidibacter sp. RF13 TaxID=2997340 RepID=UPI002270A160|nr:branched-chain amino acid ABC transporter permease [Frigidibacter sp. RF13]MCY1127479.1 branched-chain amino acid ABC transporter permease [Frigidibacter sp. RF13]
MEFFLQQLLNAVSLGGIYALLALGLAVVFSIVALINFAHGELMTVAGYVLFVCILYAVPLPIAVVAAIGAAAVAAAATERLAFRPMRRADPTSLMLTSFAVSAILKVLFQNGISARPKPVPLPPELSGTLTFGPVRLGTVPLASILVTCLSLAALTLFLKRTVMGKAMRAAAEDFQVLRLMGIRANRVIAAAFALSGMLAGISAALWVAQRGSVDPLMGFVPVLKAFVASVIGGLGSLSGAVAGGFALGIAEVLFQAYLPEAALPFRDAFVLGVVILILLWRPDGLIPAKTGRRS